VVIYEIHSLVVNIPTVPLDLVEEISDSNVFPIMTFPNFHN
jgi:hypothetical protein